MRTVRDYGPYARMFRHGATRRIIAAFKAASKETGIPYLVIGGSAAYLHTSRNPVDYPDLDVVLDATKSGAARFVSALRSKARMRIQKLAETETDVFYKIAHRGLDVDLFTEQEDRPNLGIPVVILGVPVKRIEGLIAEKLSRFSYPDILMLFDLLRKKHDRDMVRRFALRINALGRLTTLEKVIRAKSSMSTLRRWAALMAGGERRGHIV